MRGREMWGVSAAGASSLFALILALLLLLHGSHSSTLLDEDTLHLQAFVNKTQPASWPFHSAGSPCNWTGIVRCNGDGEQKRVTGLLLEGLGLRGSYPVGTLGKLSALTQCSLFNNSLSGALPQELWSLPRLDYLSLSRNFFSGSLPPQVAQLTQLGRLDLSHNFLSGPIPVELGKLPNLRYLFLSSNSFTGSIPPQLFNCNSLVYLDLSSNRISGSIPEELVSLSNLVNLNLSNNALQRALPTLMYQMHRLTTLDLSTNSLTGSLLSLQGLIMLNVLILSHNKFTIFPPQLNNLTVLSLRSNRLAGTLPSNLGSQLTELDLSLNFLEGDISVFLGSLPSSLSSLDLSSNKLTGNPNSWNMTRLSALLHLGLADNDFSTGSCQWIDGFPKLQFLNLSGSHLTGTIPEGIGRLSSLTELDLSQNALNGSIPASIENLHSLAYLDLSRNNLSGGVSCLRSLTALRHLNISYNDQTACVPSDLLDEFGAESFKGICNPLAADIPQHQARSAKRSKLRLAVLVGATAGSVLVVCGIVAAVILRSRRVRWAAKKAPVEERYVSGPFSFETDSGMWVANVKDPSAVPVVIFEKPLLNLTFADLLQATSNFSKESQLTEGGFGPVYRASLPGGLDVAIKVLIEGRVLTDEEAAAEFGVLSKIKHPNLVPLLGYCVVGDERLVIYEYMENGGLHRWLHDLPVNTQLDDWSRDLWQPVEGEEPASGELVIWARRHKIALGVARALAYLHHGQSPPMVHRDVKASNVMLDEEFEPHLANMGLAGLLAGNDDGLFAGSTPGYAPPEYRQPGGMVCARGDVYSYGVVLLELVTGKRPVGDSYQEGYTGNLVGWVRLLMKEKRAHRALDPRIVDRAPISEMLEALRVGYLCTAELPAKRPTMQQIVGLLKDMEPHGSSP